MATINDIHMASGPNQESYVPPQLRAGDGPFNTIPVIVQADEVLQQYEVVARISATGKVVAWNPGASDGSENALGVTCYAVDATGADVEAAIYVSGFFNTNALVWPAEATALQKTTAFDRTPIKHRTLYGEPPTEVVSIAFAPAGPIEIEVGSSAPFTATATYSDGSTALLTGPGAYSESELNGVSIVSGNPMTLLATAAGTSTVIAKVGDVSASLTVNTVDAG